MKTPYLPSVLCDRCGRTRELCDGLCAACASVLSRRKRQGPHIGHRVNFGRPLDEASILMMWLDWRESAAKFWEDRRQALRAAFAPEAVALRDRASDEAK
jgi:hypothetical protein